MIVVPVAHQLIDLAAVQAAGLLFRFGDEMTEQRGAGRRQRHMVDIAVERLVHAEHEPGHAPLPFLTRAGVVAMRKNWRARNDSNVRPSDS
jgi:hypothetical protein